MDNNGNFWEVILESGVEDPSYDHQRRRGSLEDVFDLSGQQWQPLEPELRLLCERLFRELLEAFRDSRHSRPDGSFRPLLMVQSAHEQAIGQSGKDRVITTYFHFLTCDIQPTPQTPQATYENIRSQLDPPRRVTRVATEMKEEEKDRLMRRVREWAMFLLHAFFRPLKAQGGSPREFVTPQGFSMSQSHSQLGTPHRLAALRRRCLARDRHRCVITRRFDDNELFERTELDRDAKDDEGNRLSDLAEDEFDSLEVAHIIPHAMNASGPGSVYLPEAQEMTRAILNMFDPEVLLELEGADIDRPRNAITLTTRLHRLFGALRIAIQPTALWTAQSQEYRIEMIRHPFIFQPVTRVFLDTEREEMPSRRYLEWHAACARMCQLSGAGDYIDRLNRELEEGSVRADGKTNLGSLVGARLAERFSEAVAAC
ncbi:MAG: hypothetical protein M4579_006078 [Chaenotheca gracillima]|nr:MAG: hypothetical protein M4579_006078 [Chaenotheca gracillima]